MYFSLNMFNSFSIGDWLQLLMEQEAKEVYGMERKSGVHRL